MKKFSLLVLLFFSVNCVFSQSLWFSLNSGTTKNLNSIFFLNANTGYVTGDSAIILKTTNAGLNWTKIFQSVNNSFVDIMFFDSMNAIACGRLLASPSSGFIFKSTNGGVNWTSVGGGNGYPTEAAFPSPLIGYVIGSPGNSARYVLKTINGGNNWSSQLDESLNYMKTISFLDVNTGFAGGAQGEILKTTNGGINWNSLSYSASGTVNKIFFFNSSTGYLCTDFGYFARTSNGGNTWTTLPVLGTNTSYNSTWFISPGVGYGVAFGGTIVQTNNGGTNWVTNSSPSSATLNDIAFTSYEIGYIAGNNGTILKTTSGGLTFVQQVNSSIPEKYALSQNFPNPFNPETEIQFDLPEEIFVSLKVYDISGKEVANLFSGIKEAGKYTVSFDANRLPSGTYFYTLQTGKFTETKKMVLMK
ncbi:MAG: T9SS type A sorting domain-containing protein [Ignavibacteria bacterium]|nr:T9SS type A sorting domain-containing protein [Ignavibacteria bacterium]